MSGAPIADRTASNRSSPPSSVFKSAAKLCDSRPAARIRALVSSAGRRLPWHATDAPASASAKAMAAPSPLAEPVTSATLPSKQKRSRIPMVIHYRPGRLDRAKIVPMLAQIDEFRGPSHRRDSNVLKRRIECESWPASQSGGSVMPEGALRIKAKQECRWDVLSLGEVMLRFDPGERRIVQTRQFDVWEGGGEYNVARGLSCCFGQRASVVTALVDNTVGRLVESLMLQGGVDV